MHEKRFEDEIQDEERASLSGQNTNLQRPSSFQQKQREQAIQQQREYIRICPLIILSPKFRGPSIKTRSFVGFLSSCVFLAMVNLEVLNSAKNRCLRWWEKAQMWSMSRVPSTVLRKPGFGWWVSKRHSNSKYGEIPTIRVSETCPFCRLDQLVLDDQLNL